MDFIEGFPRVGGKTVVLTIVDRFSKYAHFIPLSHPYIAMSVAQAFFDSIVRLHGFPRSIVSDRDPVFTSTFLGELFKLAGVTLRLSTAFHPQTDGQSEVTNRILGVYLRCLAGDRPKGWLRWLRWAEYCYNTNFQSALRTTPFHVVYGRDPSALIPYQPGSARVQALDRQLLDRDTFLADICDRLLHAQELMKRQYDEKHRPAEFAVGDWVWLRLHQRMAAAMAQGASYLHVTMVPIVFWRKLGTWLIVWLYLPGLRFIMFFMWCSSKHLWVILQQKSFHFQQSSMAGFFQCQPRSSRQD
jgi:hypothetical protein